MLTIISTVFSNYYRWNVFDVTKVWPHSDYPLHKVGILALNRNPDNYFAETEQAAFSPSHLVPGIEPTFDRMLQGRLFSYPDTHRHRLGANYNQLPINCPYRVNNQQRDGQATVNGNMGKQPNYEPNSFFTPKENKSYAINKFNVEGTVQRTYANHPNCDFAQPGALFSKVMNDQQRANLINNISGHLKNAKPFVILLTNI